jgi:hypothetical protein
MEQDAADTICFDDGSGQARLHPARQICLAAARYAREYN